MYLADYHVHSTCSPDGHQTMAQAAEAAVRQGLRELCITDHVDTIHWGTLAPRDDFDWEESRRQFHEAQALWEDRITLRRGAELGEAQLSFDRADRLLAGEELDFVIGSVHLSGKKFANMDLYYIEKGSEAYYDSVIDSYLDDVLALARWGRFQVLGHLTLPLRYINEQHGEHMTFRRHMDRVEEIFRAIIPQGVGIECNTNRGNEPLPGEEILRLYRERSETALTETERQYGALCGTIAQNILRNRQDAEECVNDTWHRAWNSIPPEEPRSLAAYLGRITRNLALNRLEKQNRQKRGGGEMTLIWEELGEMLPDRDTPEQHWERRAIAAALERFLRGLTPEERILFLRRYWWAEPVKTAAAHSGISPRRARSILERLRRDLRNELEKEEITL